METAKVDIRKLQLLNDRINQCIDALNQVRISVHGLSHTAGQALPGMGYPFAQGTGFGLGYAPFAQSQIGSPFLAGLSHTPAVSPFGMAPSLAFQTPFQNPWLTQVQGLSHTGTLESAESYARPLWADPLLAARVAQTFPYAQFGVPPVVSIY